MEKLLITVAFMFALIAAGGFSKYLVDNKSTVLAYLVSAVLMSVLFCGYFGLSLASMNLYAMTLFAFIGVVMGLLGVYGFIRQKNEAEKEVEKTGALQKSELKSIAVILREKPLIKYVYWTMIIALLAVMYLQPLSPASLNCLPVLVFLSVMGVYELVVYKRKRQKK